MIWSFLFIGRSLVYSYEEVYEASLEYFNGDELATNVFVTKYALQNNDGHYLEKTPDDMHHRIAKEFARIEKDKFKEPLTEEQIFELLRGFKRIIPQGSPMYGIGNKYQYVTLSNCYVLPSPCDSYLGITYLDSQITQISSRRGGCGWDMSTLRPKNMKVTNAAGSTTGVVSFMNRYSNTVREVCQSGRRGASLQSLKVNHPEIMNFIKCKNDDTSITGSNISVQFTDEFMDCIINNKEEFELKWPVDSDNPRISIKINPQDIWKAFIDNTWNRAEPGAMFVDTVHRRSTSATSKEFEEVSSNPCAEQYLPAYGCCRLLAINLYTYVQNKFTPKAYFDYQAFSNDVRLMQRLADDMVDLDIECIERIIKKIKSDPEPLEIKQIGIDLWENIKMVSKLDRRTGCGIVGLADCLAAMNMKYTAPASIHQCDAIFKILKHAAYESSVEMAKEIGSFPVYDYELDKKSEFIQELKDEEPALYNKMKKYGRRNMTLLTVAPTGSVSLLTQTSSGIEPVFMLEYTRRKKINPSEKNVKVDFVDKIGDKWTEYKVYHRGFLDWQSVNNDNNVKNSPYYRATAHDIDYVQKVKLQATIQKHIDNSISVTTNLPKDITKEKVSELYLLAYKLGCKGFTIYRDGCRSGVLISDVKTEFPLERPRELPCDVHHISIKGQQYFILVGLIDGRPYEVFAGKNGFLPQTIKTGTIIRKKKDFYKAIFDGADEELSPITATTSEMEECITRLVSGLLRTGADMYFVVKQLEKVGEHQTDMHSFARSVARALKKYIPDGTKDGSKCPECGEELIRESGCKTCRCGYSACS